MNPPASLAALAVFAVAHTAIFPEGAARHDFWNITWAPGVLVFAAHGLTTLVQPFDRRIGLPILTATVAIIMFLGARQTEARSVRQITADVARWSGVRAPRRELSARTAKLLFRLAGPWLALTGRRLPVPLEQLDSLERHWNFDDSRARRELAWTPRGLDEGLPVTLDYLRRAETESRS